MWERLILYLALFLIYFHIGGLATTNILRLTKGNTLPVLSSVCRCDGCGGPIPPHLQLPVISYFLCKGRCKACGVVIPRHPLFLELAVMLGMFAITLAFHFSVAGVACGYLYYELLRILTVAILGKRESGFAQNYVIAVLSMVPFFLLTAFVALIRSQI